MSSEITLVYLARISIWLSGLVVVDLLVRALLILRLLRDEWLLVSIIFFYTFIWISCEDRLRLFLLIFPGLSNDRWRRSSRLRWWGASWFLRFVLWWHEIAQNRRRWFCGLNVRAKWYALTLECGEGWLFWLGCTSRLCGWSSSLSGCSTLGTTTKEAHRATTRRWGLLGWLSRSRLGCSNLSTVSCYEIRVIFIFNKWKTFFPGADWCRCALYPFKVSESIQIANNESSGKWKVKVHEEQGKDTVQNKWIPFGFDLDG